MNYFVDQQNEIMKHLEIILVKKLEEKEKNKQKSKKKFKRLEIEGINENNIHKKNTNQEEKEKEYEEFMEENDDGEDLEENSKLPAKPEKISITNKEKTNETEKTNEAEKNIVKTF